MYDFDGATYSPARDRARLSTQLECVTAVMVDRDWHTLAELSRSAGGSVASVSARIRDLRKPRFGRHKIERRYVGEGVWEYRMAW